MQAPWLVGALIHRFGDSLSPNKGLYITGVMTLKAYFHLLLQNNLIAPERCYVQAAQLGKILIKVYQGLRGLTGIRALGHQGPLSTSLDLPGRPQISLDLPKPSWM